MLLVSSTPSFLWLPNRAPCLPPTPQEQVKNLTDHAHADLTRSQRPPSRRCSICTSISTSSSLFVVRPVLRVSDIVLPADRPWLSLSSSPPDLRSSLLLSTTCLFDTSTLNRRRQHCRSKPKSSSINNVITLYQSGRSRPQANIRSSCRPRPLKHKR